VYNLKEKCDEMDLEYDEVSDELESRLEDTDRLVDVCGVVVSQRWIDALKDHVRESGRITVSDFAKRQGISREAMRRQIIFAEQEIKSILQGKPPGKPKRQKTSSSLTWGWS